MTTRTRKKGRPVTAPVLHLWAPSQGDFIRSSGGIIPSRFHRIQRGPRVSVSFTKFAGTGLTDQRSIAEVRENKKLERVL
ncbi:hypothetical protein WEI85_37495 [Actinomycetes bacterium KLBMP 9797]